MDNDCKFKCEQKTKDTIFILQMQSEINKIKTEKEKIEKELKEIKQEIIKYKNMLKYR